MCIQITLKKLFNPCTKCNNHNVNFMKIEILMSNIRSL